MQIVDKTLEIPAAYNNICCFGSIDKFLIADIETTGLSPCSSQLYLIGCLYHPSPDAENCSWNLRQWLIERPSDEQTVLKDFLHFCEAFDTLITFNGVTFDVPYLSECIHQYHLEHLPGYALLSGRRQHIDLYKHFRPLKNLLSMPNAKLKSFEQIIGIYREDIYTGFDLIEQYQTYSSAISHLSSKPLTGITLCAETAISATLNLSEADLSALCHNLLLHNEEDIANIPKLFTLFSYGMFFECARNQTEIAITCYEPEDSVIKIEGTWKGGIFPAAAELVQDGIVLKLDTDSFRLNVPLYFGELKYFYTPYTDYYYLPEEDMAIHKKLAQFVDSAHRRKATRQTCYTRKSGCFLPQYGTALQPCFSAVPLKDSEQDLCFVEWQSSLLSHASCDSKELLAWCCHMLAAFCPKTFLK